MACMGPNTMRNGLQPAIYLFSFPALVVTFLLNAYQHLFIYNLVATQKLACVFTQSIATLS
jgi:hypothetical protein